MEKKQNKIQGCALRFFNTCWSSACAVDVGGGREGERAVTRLPLIFLVVEVKGETVVD